MNARPIDREEIFSNAAEIKDLQKRAEYLQEACQGDLELMAEIEELLPHDANTFLEHGAVRQDSISERPGQQIGPYKLREQIGEGGFGLVFVAEQTEPVRRKVALKVIKPGMDTKEVLARFQAEQQALALMDHPHIARVFDAGQTESGRPYFVMELVKGIPIVEYCQQQGLDVRERMELFIAVCQAIQHAHAKGVIHRDLKPSNVMVAPHDGVPVVKVIDFGVAKAIGQQLTEQTIYTRYAQMIGTPLYMSPEQAEINAIDVDIRSDIYSLGVLLYELLTGVTPFDRERFSTVGFDEIRRIIKEEDPPRPSTRVTTRGELQSTVSGKRQLDPARLSAVLSGDLDWIVMKALEKERSRRYQTAGELVDDLRNYLNDEPVAARPPTLAYQVRKFVRRNRVAATIAATLVIGLTVAVVGTSAGLIHANQAAEQARDSEEDARISEAKALAAIEEREEAYGQLEDSLRISRTSEIRTLIDQRARAYKPRVYDILRDLIHEHLPDETRAEYRQMALDCLGDPAALEPFAVLEDFDAGIYGVEMSGDGNWLAVSLVGGEVSLVEVATQRKSVLLPETSREDTQRNIQFVNDRLLAVTKAAQALQFYNLSDEDGWVEQGPRRTYHGGIRDFSVIDDGERLAVAHRGGVAYSDRSSGAEQADVTELRHPDVDGRGYQVFQVSMHPEARLIAATLAGPGGARVTVWDVEAEAVLGTRRGNTCRFSQDGKWLVLATNDMGIEVFATDSLHDFANVSPTIYRRGDWAYGSRFIEDGRTMVVPSAIQGDVCIWDLRANRESVTLDHGGFVLNHVAASRSGSVIASAGRASLQGGSVVKLWNLNSLPEYRRVPAHDGVARGLNYSPDGKWLASTGSEGTVGIWEADTGRLVKRLEGGGVSVEFSPDGRWLAAAGTRSAEVTLWRTDDWTRFRFNARLGSRLFFVHFCDNGERLAVSGLRGVRLLGFHPDAAEPVPEFEENDETLLTRGRARDILSDSTRLVWMDATEGRGPKTAFSYEFAGTGEPLDLGLSSLPLGDVAIHPDGGLLLNNPVTGRVEQVDFEGNSLGPALGDATIGFNCHPHKPWVVRSARESHQIRDRETGRVLMSLPSRGPFSTWDIVWNPTRDQFAVARTSGVIEIWNVDRVQEELAELGL